MYFGWFSFDQRLIMRQKEILNRVYNFCLLRTLILMDNIAIFFTYSQLESGCGSNSINGRR